MTTYRDILMWGSRNFTPRHLSIFSDLSWHATLAAEPPLGDFFAAIHARGEAKRRSAPQVATNEYMTETPRLVNGDGPPGSSVAGAFGADKLALLACFGPVPFSWADTARAHYLEWSSPTVQWHRVEPQQGESWGQAAARRSVSMAEVRPARAYVVHTDLDRSKGSSITAKALLRLGIGFWYLRVTQAGAVAEIEWRRP